jgi:hypothetical protein
LGNVAPSPSGTIAVFGTSSGGPSATPTGPYYRTDNLVTDFGYGPGVELAAQLIQSGIPVIFNKVDTDTPGDVGSITHTGTGTSVLTITGDPFDRYDVIVTPVKAGTAGTDPEPQFTISLDGGVTVSKAITMPANHVYAGLAASTGMTLNFTAATLVVGDTYTFETTPPLWAAADVATAVTALKNSTKEAGLIYVVGPAEKADANTISAATNEFEPANKFVSVILESRDFDGDSEAAWMADLINDFQTFEPTGQNVGVAAGYALIPSAISGVNFRRNIGQLAIVRAGLVAISRDLGAVEDGALLNNKTGNPVETVYHNEATNPGLDGARFITVTSYNGYPGQFFITNPNLMVDPSSDFTLLQYRRVINETARLTNIFFTAKLSTDVRLSRKTGFILERDARALESGNNSLLSAGITNPGYASFTATIVSRVDEISSTKTLTVTVQVLPLGYIKTVNVTLTFINPALGAAA